jgi:hypothetical protein
VELDRRESPLGLDLIGVDNLPRMDAHVEGGGRKGEKQKRQKDSAHGFGLLWADTTAPSAGGFP